MQRLSRALAGLVMVFASLPLAAQAAAPATLADCDAPGFQRVLHAAPQPEREARAVWLDAHLLRWPGRNESGRFRLYHSANGQIRHELGGSISGADGFLSLDLHNGEIPESVAERFAWVTGGVVLAVREADLVRLDGLHRKQLLLVQESDSGQVHAATATQIAGALDALYANAAERVKLGAHPGESGTLLQLWAPTAQRVALCLYDSGNGPATSLTAMQRDPASGVWSSKAAQDLSGQYYTYLVDVFVRGVGVVRNRVTDPYALSLTSDSARALIVDLDTPPTMPPGWMDKRGRRQLESPVDMTIYELHVRDFSISDASVRPDYRGTYMAFTETGSNGMHHLRALSQAGLSDVHLLPVFDIATIPESGCITPSPSGSPNSESQQAAVGAVRDQDCFNWGYDPYHFTAPEGSYATDASDGLVRIREFRAMVQALHQAGLRVGMDVVYNHTSTSGQQQRSVLDRVVPDYYQRYNLIGAVEVSTCCDNTATENRMMARLMIDSVVTWARDYRIDSFRFDLMGHQPRAVMEDLQQSVNQAVGHRVELLGEGWNFGEVQDGARFVQASQLSLNGSGIATFSDRARDAVRGGGCCDGGADLVIRQGWLNGLHYAPNAMAAGRHSRADLLGAADLVRVGLAGSLRDFVLQDHRGEQLTLAQIDYAGQPAGYVTEPTEVVNYVENHDNPTLFDINALKLPRPTSPAERARVQLLGAAVVAFSQGIAYYHAGIETLRSKSLDRNSFNSGDWFNRLDWSFAYNNWGVGLPPAWDNGGNWSLMRPLLGEDGIKPSPGDIAWMRDAFLDLLRIRSGTTLLRLRSAADIRQRLRLLNTGPDQIATVLVGHVDGEGYSGAGYRELLYFINVDLQAHELTLPSERGKPWALHPLQASADAADARPREQAAVNSASGRFSIPARSAVVYVVE